MLRTPANTKQQKENRSTDNCNSDSITTARVAAPHLEVVVCRQQQAEEDDDEACDGRDRSVEERHDAAAYIAGLAARADDADEAQ
jgi:hypothetical protein